jgi:DNA repair exonuclease SbcCD ATPase subunit
MRVEFQTIQIQNFHSYGAMQEIDFNQFKSTVVLIDGIDKDTEGSKIGSGKSSLIAAITFALFGETVSNIKANEIVNYIKGKDALVILTFKINSRLYKIERGRKPKILNIYKQTSETNSENIEWENISKSDDRDNKNLIQSIIKMNFETFLQTSLFSVASEHNKPFLNMTPSNQKKLLENIFNFDNFNVMIQEIKDRVKEEQVIYAGLETSISEVTLSNSQIENQLERLKLSSEKFEMTRIKQLNDIKESISFYNKINIDDETEKFDFINELKEHKRTITDDLAELKISLKEVETTIMTSEREIEILVEKYQSEEANNISLKDNICPTCSQDWFDQEAINLSDKRLTKYGSDILSFEKNIKHHTNSMITIKKHIKSKREVLSEVREAMDSIECNIEKKELDNLEIITNNLKKEYQSIEAQENHYIDEIEANKSLIREVDMSELDDSASFISNIKAFIKLSEDPKVRGRFLRKFIKQSNDILKEFKQLIPDYNIHLRFNADFTIRVMKMGKEVSSGSLSNGEKRIGNIMIMMALMKVFKLKNNVEFNAFFMDEVLDSGINGTLLESVYLFIKNVAKEENMRVYLISHREEIKEKVKEVIMVTKSRGISTIEVNPHIV